MAKKRCILPAAILAMLISASHAAAAATINWNEDYYGTVNGGTPDTNYNAGVISVNNWNNSYPNYQTSNLMDDTGTATSMNLAFGASSNDGIQAAHPGLDADGTANKELLNGFLAAAPVTGGTSSPSSYVTLTNIPYTQYSLYVYFSAVSAGVPGFVTDGAVTVVGNGDAATSSFAPHGTTTYDFTSIGPAEVSGPSAALTQTTDTTGANPPADYAVFPNLVGSSQTVTVQMLQNSGWGGIAGFQVVQVGSGAPVWSVNGSGDWNDSTNWSTGTVPNAIDAAADFFLAITTAHTVYTDAPITLGTLNFDNPSTYQLSGTGSLTLQTSTGSATVIVQQGIQQINVPTTIASNTTFNVSSGATLLISNPITIEPNLTVTAVGPGTVTYESIVTLLNGAKLTFGRPTNANTLSIGANALASIVPQTTGSPNTLELPSLTIAGSLDSWQGQLDLTNNDMVLHNGDLATITNQIKNGYNGGSWTGNGIVSSAAQSDTTRLTALGVISNDNGSGAPLYTTFEGVSVLASDVLVKFTWFGDANLDGVVDGSDYSKIDNGFLNHLTGWANGDFNYDGIIDGSDYTLIDNTFNMQGGRMTGELAPPTTNIGSNPGSSAVPEPTKLGLLVIGAAGLLGRRSRN